jgi:hypothetical protein
VVPAVKSTMHGWLMGLDNEAREGVLGWATGSTATCAVHAAQLCCYVKCEAAAAGCTFAGLQFTVCSHYCAVPASLAAASGLVVLPLVAAAGGKLLSHFVFTPRIYSDIKHMPAQAGC